MRDEPTSQEFELPHETPGPDTARSSSAAPKFYFLTVFWGNQFRDVFTDFCLPSLLADQNIPAIKNRQESRFVVVTTPADWAEFTRHPIFERLSRFIETVHVTLDVPPGPLSRGQSQLLSSVGHKHATDLAFRDAACAMIVAPDVIFSNGSVATLQRKAEQGRAMVLAVGLRAEQDGLTKELRERGLINPGAALTLSSRECVTLLLRHVHSELKVYEWDSELYIHTPVSTFWRVPDGSGIVVHSLGYTPIYVDYRRLKTHRTQTLNDNTIDGFYLYDNFGDGDFALVQDSDELMQLSLTREVDYTYPLLTSFGQRLPSFGHVLKLYNLRRFSQSRFDPMRRRAFLNPIRLHSGEISAAWKPVEVRAGRIVEAALRNEPRAITLVVATVRVVESLETSWRQRSPAHLFAALANLLEAASPPLFRITRTVYRTLFGRRTAS